MVTTRLLFPIWLVVLAVACPAAGWCADIPTAPILRIESGMHGASINGIAFDEADQQLVSVSDDKTVRIWSVADGQLLATARPPIGGGQEGALYAVALSPSGETIAAAGYTGISWDGAAEIYLFKRLGGAWLGRIALGNVKADTVNHLAFSPDSRYIAVGTNDAHGLRIVDTKARTISIVDRAYRDAIEWVDFASDGRLVTASLDGAVRLYDASFKLLATWRAAAGARPLSAVFDRDGTHVAVGFVDSSFALVLSGHDLKQVARLAGAAGRTGGLSVVAWSADGASLYGAGTYGDAAGHRFIRKWPADRSGKAVEISAGDDTVTALAGLKDGRLAFASAAPAWGLVNPDDSNAYTRGRQQADFRDGYAGGFGVSADGAVVEFGFVQGGRQRARFDLLEGTVELDPKPRPDLARPKTTSGSVTITEWRNGEHPRLNGTRLTLDANEKSRSAAVQGDWAVVGTDYFLRAYEGKKLAWRTEVPAPAWMVNLSADGHFALAGLGDGTIRWYSMADGTEILSLFATPDGQRWVAWTPEGFFDHGPGGEGLIGYHGNLVDQGRPKGAAFVAVEQVYKLFFRRDLVVEKFLGGNDAQIAAQLAEIGSMQAVFDRGLPPEIAISEYCVRADGTETCTPVEPGSQLRSIKGKIEPKRVQSPEVVLHFELHDRGGGVGSVVVRRQGAAVAADGGTRSVAGKVHNEERTITLQPGLNVIGLSVFNSSGQIETNQKDRPTLVFRYDPPVVETPVLRMISIGVDQFASPDVPRLANSKADAQGVVDIMRSDKRHEVYGDVDAILLTDEKATLDNIEHAFEDMARRAKPEDLAFVFLAGHGVSLDGKYYFLPYDLPDLSPDTIRQHALTHDELAARLSKFPTARVVVVLDTCYSGAFAASDSILAASRDETLGKQMSHSTGRFILASSSSQQEALDGIDGHGVFTGVLLRGLLGAAHKGSGDHAKVSILELGEYTKAQVPIDAARIGHGHAQQPRWFFNGDEIFDVRGVD
jgi:WD40 repeat protein